MLETLEPSARALVMRHLELVIEANEKVNLTRIQDTGQAQVLHIEDSLAALPEVNAAPDGLYGDMGSGAGYPGVPLAIATGRQTVLIDARKKKMDVMAGIIDELGLSGQVDVFAGRAELLARTQRETFAVLTARALSRLSVLMELASPLLQRGGRLICYKAVVEEDELHDARRVEPLTGMKLVSTRKFMLQGEYDRSVLVVEKVKKPEAKLPRKEGMAQKHPL